MLTIYTLKGIIIITMFNVKCILIIITIKEGKSNWFAKDQCLQNLTEKGCGKKIYMLTITFWINKKNNWSINKTNK